MSSFVEIAGVSRRFVRRPALGDRIAARLRGRTLRDMVHAVDGVDLTIERGAALGLVGESGCGKSTLGRILAGLLDPSEGGITLDGAPVRIAGEKRTTRVQMIFQDPFASLDPRMRIGDAIGEGPLAHGLVARRGVAAYVARWLTAAGLPEDVASRYPHQFSGGQRQRIAIARALAMKPDLLVCDEPVASLDVSIQAQIVNLFLRLRRELGLTLLFISHDLGVVRHLCDEVAVMYLGRVVERAPTAALFAHPRHPYTRALLDSVPQLVLRDDAVATVRPIAGELPSPLDPPPGCHFHLRCPLAQPLCREAVPALRPVGASRARCHVAEQV